MNIDKQPSPFSDITETRKQTPISTNAVNVIIGPGDPISNIPVIIDFEHHQVHEGETFVSQDIQTGLATGTVKYGFTVPVKTQPQAPHLVVGADVYAGGVLIQIYEAATFTNGSAMTVLNRNRNVSVPATTSTVKTGVTSSDGNLIESFYAGVSNKNAGSSRQATELVLKSNTIYRIDAIGQVAGTNAIITFNWYEDLGV
jgi:hypothetical protein